VSRDLVIALALAGTLTGCIVRHVAGESRVTGTCDGACDHYVECRPGHAPADRERCLHECPEVLSDRDALVSFELLECDEVLSFVDGDHPRSPVKTSAKAQP
jgi:hypothetical protein